MTIIQKGEPMDDLISRQAALDAMETWDKFGCDPDGKLVRYDDDKHYIPYVHYEDMVHAIKHLPSAQPEQRWIPCSERLPEDYEDVLVWFEYFRYGDYNRLYQTHGIGDYSSEYDSWMINHESGWRKLRVFAWMPLPEPYREERIDE